MCFGLAACCISNLICWCPCPQASVGPVATRLTYTFGLFLVTVLMWVLRNWGDQFTMPAGYHFCQGECFGYSAVYRASLGLVLYHATMALFTMGITTSRFGRARFHNGFWLLKALMLAGSLTLCFVYIPDAAFTPYSKVAAAGAVLFIIINSMTVIDMAYLTAGHLVKRHDAAEDSETQANLWASIIIGTTGVCYALVLAASVVVFALFTGEDNPYREINQAFAGVNIGIAVVAAFLSISEMVKEADPRSGLLQSAVVAAYSSYMMLSAVSSQMTGQVGSEDGVLPQVLFYLGFSITMLSMCVSAFGTTASLENGGENPLIDFDEEEMLEAGVNAVEWEGVMYSYSFMHVVFVLAGMYVACLLTNWAVLVGGTDTGGNDFSINKGDGAMWIKAATGWFITGYYAFILLANVCCARRD